MSAAREPVLASRDGLRPPRCKREALRLECIACSRCRGNRSSSGFVHGPLPSDDFPIADPLGFVVCRTRAGVDSRRQDATSPADDVLAAESNAARAVMN